jgi:hypothetical protein
VIALRASNVLQIFNLELRAKMKSYTMTAAVVFWRWISPNMIALVTSAAVFHWSIGGDDAPVKVFDRNPAVTDGCQIINYQVSEDSKWSLLCAISAGAVPGEINGNMQLFSIEKGVSQMLQGHSGCFTTITVPGRAVNEPAQLLCFEDKKPDQVRARLHFPLSDTSLLHTLSCTTHSESHACHPTRSHTLSLTLHFLLHTLVVFVCVSSVSTLSSLSKPDVPHFILS